MLLTTVISSSLSFDLIIHFNLHFLAKENKFDVVLVDTAGRMQDNEPLMKALAKVKSKSISSFKFLNVSYD